MFIWRRVNSQMSEGSSLFSMMEVEVEREVARMRRLERRLSREVANRPH